MDNKARFILGGCLLAAFSATSSIASDDTTVRSDHDTDSLDSNISILETEIAIMDQNIGALATACPEQLDEFVFNCYGEQDTITREQKNQCEVQLEAQLKKKFPLESTGTCVPALQIYWEKSELEADLDALRAKQNLKMTL